MKALKHIMRLRHPVQGGSIIIIMFFPMVPPARSTMYILQRLSVQPKHPNTNKIMKPFFKFFLLYIMVAFFGPGKGYGQASSDRNFKEETDIIKPGTTNQAQINALGTDAKLQSVSYFDGL